MVDLNQMTGAEVAKLLTNSITNLEMLHSHNQTTAKIEIDINNAELFHIIRQIAAAASIRHQQRPHTSLGRHITTPPNSWGGSKIHFAVVDELRGSDIPTSYDDEKATA